MTEVFVVSGVRTAIGAFGGTLKDIAPAALGAVVAREAIARAGIEPGQVNDVVFGQVIQTEPQDMYLGRVAAINAGVPHEVPALTLNRLCGSGLQAILTAAQGIMLGTAEIALAGGAECMTRAPFQAPSARWGSKMGDARLIDVLNGVLTDPFHRILMGVTAENVAERYNISRDEQDALALESHRRAAAAVTAGYFKDQILGVEVKSRGQVKIFDTDEHVRHNLTLADVQKLNPVFKKEGGTVTPSNASGINDAAAAVILASGEAVRKYNLKPLLRLVSYANAGVDPAYMGIGPVPASRLALSRAGLKIGDIDVIEANEAFAAQACAVSKELNFDPARVNPNGSGISLGHPVGATGAINTVKTAYELARTGGKYGLVTMCIGGGQGITAIFERV
jgi:acetyl-CoA C-acetyltransferase